MMMILGIDRRIKNEDIYYFFFKVVKFQVFPIMSDSQTKVPFKPLSTQG